MQQTQYAQQLQSLLRPAAGYARSIVRDHHTAEDALQQAALRGLEKLHTFDDSRPFRVWWFAILHNCCIDILRVDRSSYHVEFDEEQEEGSVQGHEAGEQLICAIAQLSDDHQEILRLKYFADLSYKELAAVLEIPQGTVMSRLHLARLALAVRMKENT
jgi:RNA polymerase sigma-70 factor, ECF subfamily